MELEMATSIISKNGSVIIPAELRKRYNLAPGTKVVIVDYGGVLPIIPASKDPVKVGKGMLKGLGSLTEDIVEEHRHEREREDSRGM
jgi:AbrB family looped-hinge helix DNA binding protein